MVAEDLVITDLCRHRVDLLLDGDSYIVHPAASGTTDVIVGGDNGIKTFLGPTHLKFENNAAVGHQLEIAIDGTEPYPRQPAANHIVYLVGRRMAGHFAEFFEDNLPLRGQPHVCSWLHWFSSLKVSMRDVINSYTS
jgi:hypothetical protein